jgi:hypothetical protein
MLSAPKEVGVPDAKQRHNHRHVAGEGCGAEVLIHGVEAGQHRAEMLWPDGEHRRQPDRRIHRVAPADPIPETEHVGCVDAKLRNFRGVGRDGDKMVGDRCLVAERVQQPAPRRVCVGHCLLRGEGFGGDDEECPRWIEVAHRLGKIGAVNVGDEAEAHITCTVVAQRFIGHHRPQVRAADADVDDVADALTSEALPRAAAHAFGERAHLIEHGVHLRHDILTIDNDMRVARGAQGDMQHGAIFGHVDLVAAKHRVDTLAQVALLSQLQQQLQRLICDSMLGIVEVKPQVIDDQAVAASRVLVEKVAQVNRLNSFGVFAQFVPCGAGVETGRGH